MTTQPSGPKDVDAYIARFPLEVREIPEKIRSTIKQAAPGAEETLKYHRPPLPSTENH